MRLGLNLMIALQFHRILIYFHLLLVILLITNKAVYSHTHILADGSIIVHAHPYDKSSEKNPLHRHHHPYYEYLNLANLDFFDNSIDIFIFDKIELVIFEKQYEQDVLINSINFVTLLNKSPPMGSL